MKRPFSFGIQLLSCAVGDHHFANICLRHHATIRIFRNLQMSSTITIVVPKGAEQTTWTAAEVAKVLNNVTAAEMQNNASSHSDDLAHGNQSGFSSEAAPPIRSNHPAHSNGVSRARSNHNYSRREGQNQQRNENSGPHRTSHTTSDRLKYHREQLKMAEDENKELRDDIAKLRNRKRATDNEMDKKDDEIRRLKRELKQTVDDVMHYKSLWKEEKKKNVAVANEEAET